MTNASELLEALKRREAKVPDPPQELAENVLRAIRARIATGEPVPELDTGVLIASASKAGAVVLKIVGSSAIVALIVLGLGHLGTRAPSDVPLVAAHPVETASVEAPPVATPAAPMRVEAPPIEPVDSPAVPTPSAVLPPAGASRRPAVDPPPSSGSAGRPKTRTPEPDHGSPKSLADEIALAGRIASELKKGAWKRTLSLVAEHERDFPDGQFVEERHAAKARALCHVGTGEAGLEEASSFAKRWPTSIHLAVVRRDCEGI
jgi:hypothetical protein